MHSTLNYSSHQFHPKLKNDLTWIITKKLFCFGKVKMPILSLINHFLSKLKPNCTNSLEFSTLFSNVTEISTLVFQGSWRLWVSELTKIKESVATTHLLKGYMTEFFALFLNVTKQTSSRYRLNALVIFYVAWSSFRINKKKNNSEHKVMTRLY